MIENYHTHTTRCRHASGTEEEYVCHAIDGGLKVLGFSDHTPFIFPDGYYTGMRMFPDQLEDYVASVLALKEKYKKDSQIYCGVEEDAFQERSRGYGNGVRDPNDQSADLTDADYGPVFGRGTTANANANASLQGQISLADRVVISIERAVTQILQKRGEVLPMQKDPQGKAASPRANGRENTEHFERNKPLT